MGDRPPESGMIRELRGDAVYQHRSSINVTGSVSESQVDPNPLHYEALTAATRYSFTSDPAETGFVDCTRAANTDVGLDRASDHASEDK
jgi:hypothetical protein